jgi:hypothetical protein
MLLNTVIENLSFYIIILGIFAPQLYTKMFLKDELNPLPDGPLAPPLTDGPRSDWT